MRTPRFSSSVYASIVACGLVGYVVYWTTGYPPHRLTLPLLLVGFWLMLRRRPFAIGPWIAKIGSPLALVWGISLYRDGVPAIITLSNFTSVIMAMQWMIVTSPRLARQGLVLAGMLVLASAAMNVNFFLPLAMLPFLLLLGWSLSRLAIVEDSAETTIRIANPARFPRWVFAGGLLGFMVFQIGLFYVTPRRETPGMGSIADQRRLLGFSDRLRLGEFGTILDNPQTVMRVKPLFNPESGRDLIQRLNGLTLRGCSFISYRNGAWSRRGYGRRMMSLRRSQGELTIQDCPPDDLRPQTTLEIFLENTDPPVLFVPEGARSIQSSLRFLSVESDGTLSMMRRGSGVENYLVLTKIGRQGYPLGGGGFPVFSPELDEFRDPGEVSPLVRELAERIASGSTSMGNTIEAVLLYLQSNCRYGLEDVPSGIRDPIAFFLFQSRRGTCEHFASAMVILLRCLGIPSRPVNGYTMGEWNEYGGYFNVQQRHAHSWVEVYFPESGWLTFDPTGTDRTPGLSLLERFSALREWWDRFEGFWFTYVYSYDGNSQRELFLLAWLRFWRMVRRSPVEAGLAFLGGILLIWVLGRRLKAALWQPWDQCEAGKRESWIPDWYREWASRAAIPRKPSETPAEFHRRLLAAGVLGEHQRAILSEIESGLSEFAFGGRDAGLEKAREALARLLDPVSEKR